MAAISSFQLPEATIVESQQWYGDWALEISVCQCGLNALLRPKERAQLRTCSPKLELVVQPPYSRRKLISIKCLLEGRRQERCAARAA